MSDLSARTIPVYLAGPSRELPRVLKFAHALEQSGLVRFTYRWWDDVIAQGVGADAALALEAQQRHALADTRGVDTARIVWALWHHCIFTSLAHYRDPSDDCGLVEVLRAARGMVQAMSVRIRIMVELKRRVSRYPWDRDTLIIVSRLRSGHVVAMLWWSAAPAWGYEPTLSYASAEASTVAQAEQGLLAVVMAMPETRSAA